MTRAIHQLLPTFAPGDAIGGTVTAIRGMLRDLGYTSHIYTDAVDLTLTSEAEPLDRLAESVDADDTVIYHLSTGSRAAGLFGSLHCRRVVFYHNITPPSYFAETSPHVALQLIRGREQLRHLAALSDLCIAASDFNAGEAVAAGYRRVVVIPPRVDLARLDPKPAQPVQPPELLFVGRFALNKRHDTLIRAFALLRQRMRCHLVLAGAADDNSLYVEALRALAERLGVADAVSIKTGRHPDAELRRLYMRASAYVCASEHEGFCVPIVEALAFEVPVVARRAAAVPSTVGDAALLVDGDDPVMFAATIERAVTDARVRDGLIAAGRRRLTMYSREHVAALLWSALELGPANGAPGAIGC